MTEQSRHSSVEEQLRCDLLRICSHAISATKAVSAGVSYSEGGAEYITLTKKSMTDAASTLRDIEVDLTSAVIEVAQAVNFFGTMVGMCLDTSTSIGLIYSFSKELHDGDHPLIRSVLTHIISGMNIGFALQGLGNGVFDMLEEVAVVESKPPTDPSLLN